MNDIYLVGGAGYIGARLAPILRADGWNPAIIDAGVYSNYPAAKRQDVLEMDPPGDGAPVVWLATIHREPEGLTDDERKPWAEAMERLMLDAPTKWAKAGHPLVYPSSGLVLQGGSLYAWVKRLFEAHFVGQHGVQILRFGTVWGGLDSEPKRVETAPNRVLLGTRLGPSWVGYLTHMERATAALAYAVTRPYLGSVENVFDREIPFSAGELNDVEMLAPDERDVWQVQWMREKYRAKPRGKKDKQAHPTKQLASYYKLPMPGERSEVSEQSPDDSGPGGGGDSGDHGDGGDPAAPDGARAPDGDAGQPA